VWCVREKKIGPRAKRVVTHKEAGQEGGERKQATPAFTSQMMENRRNKKPFFFPHPTAWAILAPSFRTRPEKRMAQSFSASCGAPPAGFKKMGLSRGEQQK